MAGPVKWWSILVSLQLLICSHWSQAQLVLTDSVETNKNIIAFSADRTGNIFLGLEGGSITKYNAALDSVVAYNPTRVGDFNLLEAWHGFQVFAFNKKFQDFILLDRFLTRENRYSLGNTGLYFVELATLASDQNLWVLEENGLRLMKFDFKAGETVLDVTLDTWLDKSDHQFSFIREYQNLLFLTDKNSGTYIFDNLGNFIKQMDTKGAGYLTFDGEAFFYLNNHQLIKQQLYSTTREAYTLPSENYLGLLVIGDFAYLVGSKKVKQYLIPKN